MTIHAPTDCRAHQCGDVAATLFSHIRAGEKEMWPAPLKGAGQPHLFRRRFLERPSHVRAQPRSDAARSDRSRGVLSRLGATLRAVVLEGKQP